VRPGERGSSPPKEDDDVKWLKRDLRTVVVAVVAAAVTAGAPALAHGVQHALFAHNADKVDGKHAVGSGATLNKAAGNLVATSSSGRFAPKFVPTQFAAPRAFAAVDSFPLEFMAGFQRRGFTAVTRPATGSYCLAVSAASEIDAESATVIAGVEDHHSDGGDLHAYWSTSDSVRPAGQIAIRTWDVDADGMATPSNTVAFTVAVF
jgi:hypothetical protein